MSPSSGVTSGKPTAPQIAQDALKLIAKCGLPPMPRIYEVFFHYFEGDNHSLSSELSHRIDSPESITLELVEALHNQYFHASPCSEDERLALKLGDEVANFRQIVQQHRQVGEVYAQRLDTANQEFARTEKPESVVRTASVLSKDTNVMQGELESLQQRVSNAERQVTDLQSELHQAQRLMMTDHLTGLGNRRFYEAQLRRAVQSPSGEIADEDSTAGVPYLTLIDCDKFKLVNDRFGHPVGDEVLRLLGEDLCDIRPEVSVARLGGDEFAVFCNFTSAEEVAGFADELRMRVAERRVVHRQTGETLNSVTLSIGIARIRSSDNEETWHERADKLLYQAKNLGGDRARDRKKITNSTPNTRPT